MGSLYPEALIRAQSSGPVARPWLEFVCSEEDGQVLCLVCAECKVFPFERSLVNGEAHGSLQHVCGVCL